MTFKPTSIQINPLECKIYEGTICDKENCTEKENEFEEMKVCPECGGKHFLIKKIRKED